ncbi:MAG: hypothetical protein AAF387_09805 [Pseudomonadota bacterium]
MYVRTLSLWLFFVTVVGSASAEVVFVYDGACTALNRADCSAFGLEVGDSVRGFINVPVEFGEPGAIANLNPDQYDFGFEFGSHTFSTETSLGVFSMLVSGSGTSISSMLASFQSHEDPEIVLTLLTPSTVQISRGSRFSPSFTRADTFGDGTAWLLGEDSDVFMRSPQVPVVAPIWLLLSALVCLVRSRRYVNA